MWPGRDLLHGKGMGWQRRGDGVERLECGWKSLIRPPGDALDVSALGVPFPAAAQWWEQGCGIQLSCLCQAAH